MAEFTLRLSRICSSLGIYQVVQLDRFKTMSQFTNMLMETKSHPFQNNLRNPYFKFFEMIGHSFEFVLENVLQKLRQVPLVNICNLCFTVFPLGLFSLPLYIHENAWPKGRKYWIIEFLQKNVCT